MSRQLTIHFDSYGISREQACIMCHLSSECGGCCAKCHSHANKGESCQGQTCSQPFRNSEGARWDTWMSILKHPNFKHLRKFLPKKYK